MKKFAFAFLCFGIVFCPTFFGQTSRTTRPRVAATPQPPVLKGDSAVRDNRKAPPVLIGDTKKAKTQPQVAVPVQDDENAVIKVETNLVTMPVSVLNRDGRFVSGLQQTDFRIFENGIEQKVEHFQSVEQPFTVVLMIDVSPSTKFQIEEIQESAITFIDQLRANDRVMVIEFDDSVRVLSEPSNNRNQLRNAIRRARIGDGTSLYEAVDRVISQELRRIQGRKAVVLFTDGVDTTSRRATYQSTVSEAEEIDALIYPIRYNTQRDGFGGGNSNPKKGGSLGDLIGIILGGGTFPGGGGGQGGSASDYETGRKYLEALARNSGGRNFEADTLNNLEASFVGIAEELRRQYSLGYYPETVGNKGDRKQIKVRVMRQNLVVRAKTSYIVGQNDKAVVSGR